MGSWRMLSKSLGAIGLSISQGTFLVQDNPSYSWYCYLVKGTIKPHGKTGGRSCWSFARDVRSLEFAAETRPVGVCSRSSFQIPHLALVRHLPDGHARRNCWVKMKNQEGNQQSRFLAEVRCLSVKARYTSISTFAVGRPKLGEVLRCLVRSIVPLLK